MLRVQQQNYGQIDEGVRWVKLVQSVSHCWLRRERCGDLNQQSNKMNFTVTACLTVPYRTETVPVSKAPGCLQNISVHVNEFKKSKVT
jgi:hypothetical protein